MTDWDAIAAMYRSLVICPECEAVIEERGLDYPHNNWCITQQEESK